MSKKKFSIKMISRNPDEYLRETKKDIHKVPRNYDPNLHPFEAPREYTRALNAVKLERTFAKPFLGELEGHRDGIQCLQKHPTRLAISLSGACDGEIRIWDVPKKLCFRAINAHEGFVRGISFNHNGEYYFSCDDKTIKQWKMDLDEDADVNEPMNTIIGKNILYSIDHHWKENIFVTSGEKVEVWDEQRSAPMRTFTWGVDSVSSLKFNPVETHLLAATASDRSILLYDIREATPLRKVILKMRSNKIAWNPIESFVFTAANEDYNLYSFDVRKLTTPLKVHMDHVSAVLDVDYAPTGKEFVTGSYDKTVRIFRTDGARSRDVYHLKRMQRVQAVMWSGDNKYIMSGSDEMGIRLWKAKASEKLGTLQPREKEAFEYNEKLKEKFAHHPQIRRIARHRHVPKSVYVAQQEHRTIKDSKKRKESNRRLHSKKGSVPFVPERKKNIVAEME